jgi:hypothetical protein
MLAKELFRSGSGSGRFQISDPGQDPGKNHLDPPHWMNFTA